MEIRATGLAFGFAMLNAIIIMLVQVTPLAIAAISWRYFLIFIFLDFIFAGVVYLTFPETANVPLEEVAALFGDTVAVKLHDANKLDDPEVEKEVSGTIDEKTEGNEAVRTVEKGEHIEEVA